MHSMGRTSTVHDYEKQIDTKLTPHRKKTPDKPKRFS